MYRHMYMVHFVVHLRLTQYCNSTILQENFWKEQCLACYRNYLNNPTLKLQSIGDDILGTKSPRWWTSQALVGGSYMRFFFPLNTCPIGSWGDSSILLHSPLPQYSRLRISPTGFALSQSLSPLFHFLLQNLLWNFMQEVRRTAH